MLWFSKLKVFCLTALNLMTSKLILVYSCRYSAWNWQILLWMSHLMCYFLCYMLPLSYTCYEGITW